MHTPGLVRFEYLLAEARTADHRDANPTNLLLDEDKHAYLTDFARIR